MMMTQDYWEKCFCINQTDI